MSIHVRTGRASERALLFAIDDDASRLYATAGISVDLGLDHPFIADERARWSAALARGEVFVADLDGVPVGFAAMGRVDGAAYLDQLSVRLDAMKRGVGSALVEAAFAFSVDRRSDGLWLDTYGHLPWNVPFYARRGFALVPEAEWKPEMRAIVESQRASLPLPGQRVVMVRRAGQRAVAAPR